MNIDDQFADVHSVADLERALGRAAQRKLGFDDLMSELPSPKQERLLADFALKHVHAAWLAQEKNLITHRAVLAAVRRVMS